MESTYIWPGDKSKLDDNTYVQIFLDKMRTQPPPVVVSENVGNEEHAATFVDHKFKSNDIAAFQPSKILDKIGVSHKVSRLLKKRVKSP